MTRWLPDHPVVVRTQDGLTQVGEIVDVVGTEQVVLPGCVLYIDPAAPWRPPGLLVADGEVAADVLDLLWGSAVVDLVLAGSSGAVDAVDASADLDLLVLLGTTRWLERWQPYPLDPGLLRLDVMLAGSRCRHLLGPDDAAEQVSDPVVLSALEAEVEALLAVVGPDGGQTARPLPGWVEMLGAPGATAASGQRVLTLAGRATADWDRVPARTISRAEASVHWSIDEATDGATLQVVAPSADSPESLDPTAALAPAPPIVDLRFRLYVTGWPLPLIEGELRALDGLGAWSAAVPVSPAALQRVHQVGPQGVHLDVAVAGLPVPMRTGSAALRARARRWGARCVASGRLAGGLQQAVLESSPDGRQDALVRQTRSAGRQAIALWRSLDEPVAHEVLATWLEDGVGRPASLGMAERQRLETPSWR